MTLDIVLRFVVFALIVAIYSALLVLAVGFAAVIGSVVCIAVAIEALWNAPDDLVRWVFK